ncbi:MAG: GNAT family N-acetyltransferase [Candidatus Nanoarchaeia archaeon]|nr:GNAT family N-acetyltransferase [Candidatus Nanoarchaeia archaeon]
MIIRTAKIKDLPAFTKRDLMLKKDQNRYYKKYSALAGEKSLVKETKKFLKGKLNSKKSRIFIAEANGKIIGICMAELEKRPPIFKYRNNGFIESVYVLPVFRGKGIGTLLLKSAIKWLKKNKMSFITLAVHEQNIPAINAYKKSGFVNFFNKMLKVL